MPCGARSARRGLLLVLGQGAEPEVNKAHDDNQDDDFRKADGEVGQVHADRYADSAVGVPVPIRNRRRHLVLRRVWFLGDPAMIAGRAPHHDLAQESVLGDAYRLMTGRTNDSGSWRSRRHGRRSLRRLAADLF